MLYPTTEKFTFCSSEPRALNRNRRLKTLQRIEVTAHPHTNGNKLEINFKKKITRKPPNILEK